MGKYVFKDNIILTTPTWADMEMMEHIDLELLQKCKISDYEPSSCRHDHYHSIPVACIGIGVQEIIISRQVKAYKNGWMH